MAPTLLTELERFAVALLDAQQTLLEILRHKRTALVTSDLKALGTFQEPELKAAERLQSLIAWRTGLLEAAHRAGMASETLVDLAESLPADDNAAVVEKLQRARVLATELQQESWVQWVITNRCCHHYGEVLELIAHQGKKPPTYQSSDWVQRGGAVLNASA